MNLKKPEVRAHRATDWSVVERRWWAEERPHRGWGAVEGGGGGRRGGENLASRVWGREGVNVWGGEMGNKMRKVSRFSYWAVALLLSPHPRISTTTPLLLHSGKKTNKQTKTKPMHKPLCWILQQTLQAERYLLFQSPWHRVCLFCVCTLDWKQERLRRRETRASLSVWTSLDSACTAWRRNVETHIPRSTT